MNSRFLFKVRTSPVQKFEKYQKSPGDILTLNDQLYHKTYPVHLRCVFKGILAYPVSGPNLTPGIAQTSPDFPGLPGTFAIFLWKSCQIKSL